MKTMNALRQPAPPREAGQPRGNVLGAIPWDSVCDLTFNPGSSLSGHLKRAHGTWTQRLENRAETFPRQRSEDPKAILHFSLNRPNEWRLIRRLTSSPHFVFALVSALITRRTPMTLKRNGVS